MNYRFCIAAIGAGLVALSAPAQAQDRALVQGKVKLDDLNLNSPAGVRTARERIDRTSRATCGADGEDRRLAMRSDTRRCRDEVRSDGEAHIAAIQQQYQAMEEQRLAAERARYRQEARRPVARQRAGVGTRYRQCTWPKKFAYKKRVCVWRYRR